MDKWRLIGSSISIAPNILIFLITSDQAFVYSSILSISFFYILSTEPSTHKAALIIPLVFISSAAMTLLAGNKLAFCALLIATSFIGIMCKVVGLNKSTGLYASAAIYFFSIPASFTLSANYLGAYSSILCIFVASILPPIFYTALTNQGMARNRELGYASKRDLTIESGSLAISTTACAIVSLKMPAMDVPMLMWSCIIVNSCDLDVAKNKALDRFAPAIIGGAIGFFIGFALNHSILLLAVSTYVSLVSLVAFRSYRIGFFVRCVSFPVGICALCGGNKEIYLRMFDVITGGGISILSVIFVKNVSHMVRKN